MARSYTWSVFADAVEKEFDGDTETRAYISSSMRPFGSDSVMPLPVHWRDCVTRCSGSDSEEDERGS